MKMTAAKIVAQAMGLAADGAPARQAGCCATCGVDIVPGDLSAPLALGPGFTDDLSLAARGSHLVCGHCAVLMRAKPLLDSGYGAFSAAGHQPFRKWADIAAVLLDPPPPPFVLLYANRQNQHMAWRAPVNHSRALFYVRVGLRDLKIRHGALLAARDAAVRIGEAMGVEPTDKSLAHPFINLSSDLKDISHTLLRARGPQGMTLDAVKAAQPQAWQTLQGITLGESWALRFLLSPNAG